MPARLVCLVAHVLCAELLAGCASRPVNTPIAEVNRSSGYRFGTRQLHDRDRENLVILAFSGGGTRAAAFAYGVLEQLRRTEIIGPKGNRERLLDAVDVSFSALQDKAERDYLNDLPTSFVLSGEAVDRLRASAGAIIEQSPEFPRLLKDTGAAVAPRTVVAPAAARPTP